MPAEQKPTYEQLEQRYRESGELLDQFWRKALQREREIALLRKALRQIAAITAVTEPVKKLTAFAARELAASKARSRRQQQQRRRK